MNIELNKKNLQIMRTICKLVRHEFDHELRLSDPSFMPRAHFYAEHSGSSNIRILVHALSQELAPTLRRIEPRTSVPSHTPPATKRIKRVYRGQIIDVES